MTRTANTPTDPQAADTKVGTFTARAHGEAKKDGWIVISMKDDWKRIFAFDK